MPQTTEDQTETAGTIRPGWQSASATPAKAWDGREHTIHYDAVSALRLQIYSLAEYRADPDAPSRFVVYIGGRSDGESYTSTLLDLHTGEEFANNSAANAEALARRLSPSRLPEELLALWPRKSNGKLCGAGLDSNKGFPEVDRDQLREIANAPKEIAQATLFG